MAELEAAGYDLTYREHDGGHSGKSQVEPGWAWLAERWELPG